jgi:hypothetical protein
LHYPLGIMRGKAATPGIPTRDGSLQRPCFVYASGTPQERPAIKKSKNRHSRLKYESCEKLPRSQVSINRLRSISSVHLILFVTAPSHAPRSPSRIPRAEHLHRRPLRTKLHKTRRRVLFIQINLSLVRWGASLKRQFQAIELVVEPSERPFI